MTTHKKKIIFLVLAFAGLLWPQVLVPYISLRFYYEALPVVVVGIAILLAGFFKTKNRFAQVGVCLGLSGLIIFNLSANIAAMKATRRIHEDAALSLQFFKNKYAGSLRETPLLILNAPNPLSAVGIKQAIQLLDISVASPLWHFDGLCIHNPGEHMDNVVISRKSNEFTLKSTNQDTWFSLTELSPRFDTIPSCTRNHSPRAAGNEIANPECFSKQNVSKDNGEFQKELGKKDFLQSVVICNQIDSKIYDFSFTLKEDVQELRVFFWVPKQRVFVECNGG